MRAVRSTRPGVTVVDVDEPEGPGELIRITSASICASDLGYIEMGSTMVLGHELAGVTEDGRTVAIEAIFGCGECDLCLEGRYNLCATTGTTALGVMADGGMSEWFRAPSRSLVDLPEGLDTSSACLVEPTAVAWHTARPGRRRSRHPGRGRRRWCHRPDGGGRGPGDGRGGGVAGSPLPAPGRAGRAPRRHPTVGPLRRRRSKPQGRRARCTERAELAAPGGAMGVLGVFPPDVQWPQMLCFMKEVRSVPALGYCKHDGGRDFDDAAKLLASTPHLVDALVTHRFPIDDAPEAFRVAADKSTGALRVVLEPNS